MDILSAEFLVDRLLEVIETGKPNQYESDSHHFQDILISKQLQATHQRDKHKIEGLTLLSQENNILQELVAKNNTLGSHTNVIYVPQGQQDSIQLQQASQHQFKQLEMPKPMHLQIGLDSLINKPKENDFFLIYRFVKAKKNSNAIKKIGRIILSNLKEFQIGVSPNQGVQKMQEELALRQTAIKKGQDIKDYFNFFHLQALLFSCAPEISSYNLRTLNKLLRRKLRQQTLKSVQMRGSNRLLYLNTLKCSAMRCCNRRLAVRLQISQNR